MKIDTNGHFISTGIAYRQHAYIAGKIGCNVKDLDLEISWIDVDGDIQYKVTNAIELARRGFSNIPEFYILDTMDFIH